MAHHWFRKPRVLILTPLLVTLSLTIACGAAATPTPSPTATPAAMPAAADPVPTATPQLTSPPAVAVTGIRGGVVPMQAYASPETWDIHTSGALSSASVLSPLYNQLVEYNPETEDLTDIRGDLATSWELSADGLTYTFRLAENAKWWDDQPVTADDVVFSLDRMLEEDQPRPRSGQIRTYVDSYRTIDPHTVEITTKFAAPAFFSFLAADYMKILPRHHLETGIDLNRPDSQLGSGPYRLKGYRRDVSIEYERNPTYFKEGYPYFDGMTYFIIVEKGTVIAAYKTEQVLMGATMVTNLQTPESLKLEEDMGGRLTAHRSPPIGLVGLMMNTKVPPFDDVRVRRAINLALDRQAVIQTISGGVDQLGAPMPPGFWYGPTEEEIANMPGLRQPKDEDLAEARRLLAEAGLADGFSVTMTARTVVEFVDLAQLLVDQLRRLNIDATVRPMESAAGFAAYRAGDWVLGAQGEGPLVMDPDGILNAVYRETGTRNYSGWTHPRVSELIDLQAQELEEAQRKAYLDEISDILLNEDTHWANLYWTVRLWMVNEKIKNFHMAPSVNVMFKNEHLWMEQ